MWRLPVAVHVPWNSCHSPPAGSACDGGGSGPHAARASSPAQAVAASRHALWPQPRYCARGHCDPLIAAQSCRASGGPGSLHSRRQLDGPSRDHEHARGRDGESCATPSCPVRSMRARPRGRKNCTCSPFALSTTLHSRLAKHSATSGAPTRVAGTGVSPMAANLSTERPLTLPQRTTLRRELGRRGWQSRTPSSCAALRTSDCDC